MDKELAKTPTLQPASYHDIFYHDISGMFLLCAPRFKNAEYDKGLIVTVQFCVPVVVQRQIVPAPARHSPWGKGCLYHLSSG